MRILLATDGSPSAKNAESLCAAIAWPPDVRIDVVWVDQLVEEEIGLPPDRFTAMRAALRRDIDAQLASVVASLGGAGRTVHGRVVFGRPASVIVAEAQRAGSDLVIVGSHGRGALASFALGSVAAEVVDHAPCPVLVARTAQLGPLVLGHDGSAGARRAEDLLAEWPFLAPGPVRVQSVSVLQLPWYMAAGPAMDAGWIAELLDERRAESKRIADAAARRLEAAGLHASATTLGGIAADGLMDAIDDTHAALVVVGSRGNTGLRRVLLGSVARSVLYRAPCSVLIVREQAAVPSSVAGEHELKIAAR